MRSESDAVGKATELDESAVAKLLLTPALYEIVADLLFSRSGSEAAVFLRPAGKFRILHSSTNLRH